MNNLRKFIDLKVTWAGDVWTVGNVGIENEGRVFCHLWSTTRTLCTQKSGRNVPVNSCDWVPLEVLEAT